MMEDNATEGSWSAEVKLWGGYAAEVAAFTQVVLHQGREQARRTNKPVQVNEIHGQPVVIEPRRSRRGYGRVLPLAFACEGIEVQTVETGASAADDRVAGVATLKGSGCPSSLSKTYGRCLEMLQAFGFHVTREAVESIRLSMPVDACSFSDVVEGFIAGRFVAESARTELLASGREWDAMIVGDRDSVRFKMTAEPGKVAQVELIVGPERVAECFASGGIALLCDRLPNVVRRFCGEWVSLAGPGTSGKIDPRWQAVVEECCKHAELVAC